MKTQIGTEVSLYDFQRLSPTTPHWTSAKGQCFINPKRFETCERPSGRGNIPE
jgi:hypothetical protein